MAEVDAAALLATMPALQRIEAFLEGQLFKANLL